MVKLNGERGSDKRAGYAPPLSILHNGFRQLVLLGTQQNHGPSHRRRRRILEYTL